MLITDPLDYRIGDFVLFDGDGITFSALSVALSHYDPAWKKAPRKPWHTGFLSRHLIVNDNGNLVWEGDWWVSEAKGGVGITESPLSSFKEPYLVFRWFDTQPDAMAVRNFINEYRCEKYDKFWGYAFVIAWYFWDWWPLIIDRNWMCWEWLWFFALSFGKPIDNVHKYPLITILMDKVGYPDY